MNRVAQLEEALKLALEYWAHRQQRYKNRHPQWVQKARAALAERQPEAAPEGWREAIELIAQYRSDLKYPVAKDSRDRRIERIDAFLAKFGGSQ